LGRGLGLGGLLEAQLDLHDCVDSKLIAHEVQAVEQVPPTVWLVAIAGIIGAGVLASVISNRRTAAAEPPPG
ncbi:MAG TPA: hypothetical protein VF469_02535, partial [Kofleriaceae bacterium]